MRSATRKGTGKDKEYREFVRSFPCVLCWGFPGVYQPPGTCQVYWEYEYSLGNPSQETPTESAHTGAHGASQKSDDRTCIPLCAWKHHREGTESYHSLDIDKLVAALNQRYEERNEQT